MSREVEALPPMDIETIEGRPEARAEVRTKFKPDTLREKAELEKKNTRAIWVLLHV